MCSRPVVVGRTVRRNTAHIRRCTIASTAGAGAEIWQQIFETVAGSPEPPEQVALDSTHVKAHRCAGGGKGGRRNRQSVPPRVGGTASFMPLAISCADRGRSF